MDHAVVIAQTSASALRRLARKATPEPIVAPAAANCSRKPSWSTGATVLAISAAARWLRAESKSAVRERRTFMGPPHQPTSALVSERCKRPSGWHPGPYQTPAASPMSTRFTGPQHPGGVSRTQRFTVVSAGAAANEGGVERRRVNERRPGADPGCSGGGAGCRTHVPSVHSISAARHRARGPTGGEQRRRAPTSAETPDWALRANEPGEPGHGQYSSHVEVQPQTKQMVGRIDAQQLLEDPERRVSGHVEREQAWSAHRAALTQPDQRAGQGQVPEQLVEKRRLEREVAEIPGRAVRRIDLQTPRQLRRPAEELLVEVVADPTDRLGDQQPRRGRVHEAHDVHVAPSQHKQPGENAAGDTTPDAEAALPDGKPPPPRRLSRSS